MKSIIPVILGALAFGVLFFTSCEEKIDTAPVIKSITLNPDTVRVGETTLVTVDAIDSDGDQIIYS